MISNTAAEYNKDVSFILEYFYRIRNKPNMSDDMWLMHMAYNAEWSSLETLLAKDYYDEYR